MNTKIDTIAETLRGMINTDNDAKRLIAEAVLPLLGLPSSQDAVQRMFDAADTMSDVADELGDIAGALEELADEPAEIETKDIIAIADDIRAQRRYLTSF